jgi:signal transduction histidine kinase
VDLLTTKIREMAEHILKYQDDLKRRERDRVTGELARQIAHDIRSPLSALKIMNSKLDFQANTMNLLMSDVITRIENMAEDLLSKSRRLPSSISSDTVTAKISKFFDSFAIKAKSHQVEIDFLQDNINANLYANLDDLQRVLANLLDNSVEASPPSSTIRIKISRNDIYFQITVIDEGLGLPSQIAANLSTRNFASTKPTGNGLGLKFVYDTIESWGGKVNYLPHLPRGSQFDILIPIVI